ncbi:Hypothetical predicted protein [Olea europaea subsp. europaea]|uniref:Uncharacterized protein n=1 Tax=Olea europaea subsp. europaea TaxID=158383 RepID=A0A8S0V6X7_OLEEU|nr:Hypothetical predicted protein [Olea europaea subsp. europaea]
MGTILDDKVIEKQRKAAMQVQQAQEVQHAQEQYSTRVESSPVAISDSDTSNGCGTHRIEKNAAITTPPPLVFQGVFYRDLTVVGNLLSQARFNYPMPVKYEALSC